MVKNADLLWNKTFVYFAIHFVACWRSPGVLQSQSWHNTVKIVIFTFIRPEVHKLVIGCLVVLNTSFIKILNRTETKPRRSPHIDQSNSSTKGFSVCWHPILLLGQHSALWNICCSGFNEPSPFLCQDSTRSQISSALHWDSWVWEQSPLETTSSEGLLWYFTVF